MLWFFLQPMYDGNAYPETWVPLTRHKRAKPTTIQPYRRAKLQSIQEHPAAMQVRHDLSFFLWKLTLGRIKDFSVWSPNAPALLTLGNHSNAPSAAPFSGKSQETSSLAWP